MITLERPAVPAILGGETAEAPAHAWHRKALPTENIVLFGLCAAIYLAVGAILVFRYDSIAGDAYSRVANARYVLDSRDPKLAAIGFVWMPLPTLLLVPFLPLQGIWPGLVTRGFIGNLQSSLFMAGAVLLVRQTLADLGLRTTPRLVIVLLFALNPITIDYGANGMSEAMFLFFLLAAVCPLARWLHQPRTKHLALAGLALGLAYAARYEALVAALAVFGLVVLVVLARHRHDRRDRRHIALADGLVVALPTVAVFVVWTVTSWLIVGHPFDTFTSRYGNAAQVSAAQSSIHQAVGGTGLRALEFVGKQVFLLAPGLPVVTVVAVVVAWRRRDLWIAAPIVVLASVMAFQAATLVANQSFGWLRYQISAVPLTALLVGYLCAARWQPSAPSGVRKRPRILTLGAVIGAVILTGASVATTLVAFWDPALAGDEHGRLVPIVHQITGSGSTSLEALGQYEGEWRIAAYLDRQHLRDGSVLLDVALGFPIVLASHHPKQFVITTDRDFGDAIADPVGAGVKYVLISANTGTMDAIAATYPRLFAGGNGFAQRVREFRAPNGNGRTWRLYRVRTASWVTKGPT